MFLIILVEVVVSLSLGVTRTSFHSIHTTTATITYNSSPWSSISHETYQANLIGIIDHASRGQVVNEPIIVLFK